MVFTAGNGGVTTEPGEHISISMIPLFFEGKLRTICSSRVETKILGRGGHLAPASSPYKIHIDSALPWKPCFQTDEDYVLFISFLTIYLYLSTIHMPLFLVIISTPLRPHTAESKAFDLHTTSPQKRHWTTHAHTRTSMSTFENTGR
jgi:hypothetical protein